MIYIFHDNKIITQLYLVNARNESNGILGGLMCSSGCYRCIEVCTAFWEKLPTKREFGNFVDRYAVAMKKDSSGYVPSGFENSFGSDHVRFVAKHSKYKHCTKNLTRNLKSHQTN